MGLRKFLYIAHVHHQTQTVFHSRTTLEKVTHANREWSPSQKIRPPPRGGTIGVPSCAQGREKNHPNPNQANGRENKTTSKTRHDTTITTICYTTKEEKSLQNRNGTPPAALRTRWSIRLGSTRLERYETGGCTQIANSIRSASCRQVMTSSTDPQNVWVCRNGTTSLSGQHLTKPPTSVPWGHSGTRVGDRIACWSCTFGFKVSSTAIVRMWRWKINTTRT